MTRQLPNQDHNLRVDGLPPAIRGKITQALEAAMEYAFIGIHEDGDIRRSIEDNLTQSRYDLDRTIKTHLSRAAKAPDK